MRAQSGHAHHHGGEGGLGGGGLGIRRERRGPPGLNITPLIDVVFILLVFFMLATNFARYRLIRVDTPEETKVVETAEGAIVIGLLEDGAFSFDGDPLVDRTLSDAVAAIIAIDPGRAFLVRPQDGVSLQDAIDAYDTARRAGATAVSFSPPQSDDREGEAAP